MATSSPDCSGCSAPCCVLEGERCPFSHEGYCSIYHLRPAECRAYDCRETCTPGSKYEDMGCNCANRMRKYILPEAGYTLNLLTNVWNNSEGTDPIPDEEVENHHARLMLKRNKLRRAATRAVMKEGRKRAEALHDLFTRRQ